MVEERIDSSKLAWLLSEDFKGRIDFSGDVYGVIRGEKNLQFLHLKRRFFFM
ncbi:MAG: hypothetical protein AABX91_00575 [Nanoarchaeota archaeon]